MKLYLVQHAEAMSEEQNPERPLTAAGKKDTHRMADLLKKSGHVSLAQILHSGKLRAQQTAEIFAEELNPTGGVEQAEDLGPVDDTSVWAKKAAYAEGNLMLVGHLPYMSKMASRLLTGDSDQEVINVQNAGVICIEVGQDERGILQWDLIPTLV